MNNNDSILDGIDSDDQVYNGDSSIIVHHPPVSGAMNFIRDGERITIAITPNALRDDFSIAEYRTLIYDMIRDSQCKVLRLDFAGIDYLPSGMLGVLSSIRSHGIEIEIANPSETIRDSLSVTRLDKLFKICD